MNNHTRPEQVVHPEEAMEKVHAWTDSRVVGERAANRLEILAAFGVHLGLSASSREIAMNLAWRDPSSVELTIAWSQSRDRAPDDPEPYVVNALTVLTKGWSLHHTRHTAELVCVVEDTGSDDRSDQAEAARAALTDGRCRMAPQTA